MLENCLGCGGEFIKEWPDHAYCSDECAAVNGKRIAPSPEPLEPVVSVIDKKPAPIKRRHSTARRRSTEPEFKVSQSWHDRAKESQRRIIEKYGVKPINHENYF